MRRQECDRGKERWRDRQVICGPFCVIRSAKATGSERDRCKGRGWLLTHLTKDAKCGLRAASHSPHICRMSMSSARRERFAYCVTNSSKMVPSGASCTPCSRVLGSGRDGYSLILLRRYARRLISAQSSRKNWTANSRGVVSVGN